ncbi:hypothetical protein, partial [Colibacter massiliensis]|uniref:hypothetical protein n=1 Tax=Colibacter massiliensis TaxID=1852379 RepID=UPI00266C401B
IAANVWHFGMSISFALDRLQKRRRLKKHTTVTYCDTEFISSIIQKYIFEVFADFTSSAKTKGMKKRNHQAVFKPLA